MKNILIAEDIEKTEKLKLTCIGERINLSLEPGNSTITERARTP